MLSFFQPKFSLADVLKKLDAYIAGISGAREMTIFENSDNYRQIENLHFSINRVINYFSEHPHSTNYFFLCLGDLSTWKVEEIAELKLLFILFKIQQIEMVLRVDARQFSTLSLLQMEALFKAFGESNYKSIELGRNQEKESKISFGFSEEVEKIINTALPNVSIKHVAYLTFDDVPSVSSLADGWPLSLPVASLSNQNSVNENKLLC